jgi:uncharacterized protein YbjT (DUF2867 family)
MMPNLVAVTGATGLVGGQVASVLQARGLAISLVVRKPQRLAGSPYADVRQASGYGAFEEMRAALTGVETLFLVPATETADRVEQHKTAIDAAVSAGVERIVYLSFLGAAENATFTLASDHWHTEQHIQTTGLRWTFLRMNLYMDFIPSMVLPDGVIRGPAGAGRLSAILREDVAAACVAVLCSAGHDGRTYELTGRENFSLSEAAALMSRNGKSIRFEDETDEEAWASRRHYGAPDFEMRGWISSYQAIRDGSLERISPDVRALTGRDPTSLQEYLDRDSIRTPSDAG